MGKGAVDPERLARDYGGPKPCLHGSDAHSLQSVGAPARDRYCWLKGDLTFESLRQACLEPELRVTIGREAPRGGLGEHTITSVRVDDASWLNTPERPMHPGVARLMHLLSLPDDAFDETFDGAAELEQRFGIRLTRLDEFVAARVREHRSVGRTN